jgi:hypothetical protein
VVFGDLRVHAAHHHRLDGGQEFSDGRGWDTERSAEGKGCAHIPTDDRAGDDAQLTPKAADKVPDLQTLKG